MPRWLRFALAFWLVLAFVIWNGFFDVFVSRGEKQYLLGQARHELGIGPEVTMDEVMTTTIRDAVRKSSIWGVVILLAGVGGSAWVRRITLREIAIRRPPA
jgi:hypothetical protein